METADTKTGLEDIGLSALATITRSPNLVKWASEPEFLAYLYDKDATSTKVATLAELALERLYEILTSPIGSGKDAPVTTAHVLAATKQVVELAALVPKGETKVVFADKRLNELDAASTEKELEAMRLKLLGPVKEASQ